MPDLFEFTGGGSRMHGSNAKLSFSFDSDIVGSYGIGLHSPRTSLGVNLTDVTSTEDMYAGIIINLNKNYKKLSGKVKFGQKRNHFAILDSNGVFRANREYGEEAVNDFVLFEILVTGLEYVEIRGSVDNVGTSKPSFFTIVDLVIE